MTKSEIARLTALIGKASTEDLSTVREAYNARMKALTNEAKTGFAVGDTVSLEHRKFGGYVKGIVTKVNRTRAKVEIGLTVYNVPMSMLTKVGA
jgi:transcription antitermination factor NusG